MQPEVRRLGRKLSAFQVFGGSHDIANALTDAGADKTSTRLVFGMASLPVGVCVVLESIFEIGN